MTLSCPVCGYRSPDARGTCRRCGASLTAKVEKTLGEERAGEWAGAADEETDTQAPRDVQESVPPEVVVDLDQSLEDAAEGLRQRALRAGDRDPRHAEASEPSPPGPEIPRPAAPPASVPVERARESGPAGSWPVAPRDAPGEAKVSRWPAGETERRNVPPGPTGEWLPPSGPRPTATAVPPAYAGFWVRLIAMVVDATVLGAVVLATSVAALVVAGGPGAVIDPAAVRREFPWLPPLLTVFQTLLAALYFVYFPGATGATPGKAALRLEVRRADGQPIGFGTALLRFLGYGLEMIPGALVAGVAWVLLAVSTAVLFAPSRRTTGVWVALGGGASFLCFLGFIWAGVDARKQAWHDKLAGTVVVRRG